jgi:hypothetical protein
MPGRRERGDGAEYVLVLREHDDAARGYSLEHDDGSVRRRKVVPRPGSAGTRPAVPISSSRSTTRQAPRRSAFWMR